VNRSPAVGRDKSLIKILGNPFALVPGFKGPRQPNDNIAEWDELANSWTSPFVMAPINTKNVHRTHALLGHPWGTDFIYSERMLAGKGREAGQKSGAQQHVAKHLAGDRAHPRVDSPLCIAQAG